METVTLQNIKVHPSIALFATLKEMRKLEIKARNNPAFINFVNKTFNTNCDACKPGLIWKYMKNNFNYTPDDPYDEKISAPYILNETKNGDCDDFSMFAKTCLDILGGWYTSYMLLGRQFNEYTHIVCFAHRGKYFTGYRDAVVIDGANNEFNVVNNDYKFKKIV